MKILFLVCGTMCMVGLAILLFVGKHDNGSIMNAGLISIGIWAILDKLDEKRN